MNDRYFIDTNIVVYAYDEQDSVKNSLSREILEKGLLNETIVLSTQVLGEFFNVITRRISNPLTIDSAENIMRALSAILVIEISLESVFRAIETHKHYGVTYWDSLIIATAEQAGCTTVYSEDMNHLQKYNDIQVINPFKLQ